VGGSQKCAVIGGKESNLGGILEAVQEPLFK